ncbi:MAG: translocation/assembly module TamB domain-containing protein [Pseudomonadota bacterium]
MAMPPGEKSEDPVSNPPETDNRPAPAAVPVKRRRWGWWAAGGLLGLGVLLALGVAAAVQALRTEAGTRRLLAAVPGLQVTDPRGPLLGDFSAQRVQWRSAATTVDLERLSWRGLVWQWHPAPGVWGGLRIATLDVERVTVTSAPAPSPAPPTEPPSNLQLPVSVEVEALRVGTVAIASSVPATDGEAPPEPIALRDVRARLAVGAEGGSLHRLTLHHLGWGELQAEGEAQIASAAPMTLSARLQARPARNTPSATPSTAAAPSSNTLPAAKPTDALNWLARVDLQGPLAAPTVRAQLDTETPTATSPSTAARLARAPEEAHLTLQATVHPWAAWPLGDLSAQARGVDLSAFHASAPRTALRADAVARTHSAEQPAELRVSVHNDQAGLWSDRRLPLRSASVQLQAKPERLAVVDLAAIAAELGTREASAGVLSGRGHLSHDSWALDLQWRDLQPSRIDARAAPMRLSGPWMVSGSGTRWQTQGDWTGVLLAPAAGARSSSSNNKSSADARPVQLRFQAGADTARGPTEPDHWTLRELQAQIGEARLSASASLARPQATAPWQLKARTTLSNFDPLPWWPGPPGSVWREGGHRLQGEASVDLQGPTPALAPAPSASAPAGRPGASKPAGPAPMDVNGWRGVAQVAFTDSRLAGVPWTVDASLRHSDGPWQLALQAQAANNSLRVDGPLPWPPAPRLTGSTTPATAPLSVEVNAPDLLSLGPWWALGSPRSSASRVGGQLQVKGDIQGTWPRLRTQGHLDASDLRLDAQRLQSAVLDWNLGLAAADPLALQLQVRQATWQGRTVSQLDVQTEGRVEQHTLKLQALADALPPAWVEELPALTAAAGAAPAPARAPASGRRTAVNISAAGGLQTADKASPSQPQLPTGWQGTLQSLSVRSDAPPSAGLPAWWELRQAVALEAQWAPQGDVPGPRFLLAPGQATLAGTSVQWGRVLWQADPNGPAHLEAELRVDALPVAPWLARWQPELGWHGDLSVGLQAKIQTRPQLQAEVVLERRGGDLSLAADNGVQSLGLTNLRLGLNAVDGQWTFTQAVAGQNLGVVSGAVVAQPAAGQRWPDAQTPVQGVLELQVAQLSAWGNWLPTGWRLGGQLRVSAGVAGRLGAPEITGAVRGTQLSAKHLLEGVDITDGHIDIQLRGDTARIERFSARAGGGSLQLKGEAQLGEAPQAQLQLVLERFQLLGRVDRRLVASGTSRIELRPDKVALDGQWVIDEGLIDFSRSDAPSLSGDVQVVRQTVPAEPPIAPRAPGTPAPAPGPTPGPPGAGTPVVRASPLHLNLGVNLGEKLRLKGRGLDTGLRGELRVTSPDGVLQVNGNVNTVNGTYNAYGQKLTIDRGVVAFTGDVNNPRLDIEATRPNTETRVGVTIIGSATNPRVRLFSEPDLPDIDKLSWLVLGRGSDGLGGTDVTLLQRAAVALLAGENEGVSDQLIRAIGLDQLSVRQSDGAVKETIVSLGKQISQRWYVGYERSLNTTEGSWQLIYRLAQRFTLRAQTGFENSVDLIWTWRWQ